MRTPEELAASWHALIDQSITPPAESDFPANQSDLTANALAQFVLCAFHCNKTLLIIIPDDAWLSDISNAIDLSLRPLCLILPTTDFAAGVALRATLSLLRSRLTRDIETEWNIAWDAQRARMAAFHSRKNSHKQSSEWLINPANAYWPSEIDQLFPVCILPRDQAELISNRTYDWLLLVQSGRAQNTSSKQHVSAHKTLILHPFIDAIGSNDFLVESVHDENRLRSDLNVLIQSLSELELEFATAQAELAEFSKRYHEHIGSRIVELDAIQAQIAERQAAQMPDNWHTQERARHARFQSRRSQQEYSQFNRLNQTTEKTFSPSHDIKRLFRHLAQKIHPDRANNEADRAWRTELMSEANRAYRAGDTMVLHEILRQWESEQPERNAAITAHHTKNTQSSTIKELKHQIAAIQLRITELEKQLNRLIASRLYELFTAANLANNRNCDLIQEMADQLDEKIRTARRDLDRVMT